MSIITNIIQYFKYGNLSKPENRIKVYNLLIEDIMAVRSLRSRYICLLCQKNNINPKHLPEFYEQKPWGSNKGDPWFPSGNSITHHNQFRINALLKAIKNTPVKNVKSSK